MTSRYKAQYVPPLCTPIRRRVAAPALKTRRSSVVTLFRIAALFVTLVWLLKCSIVEAFFVPTSSMTPTLYARDYILVSKFLYGLRVPMLHETVFSWSRPERGDIVVFNRLDDPNTDIDDSQENLVKRVIGLENDMVEVSGDHVFINGLPLAEPYARWSEHGGGHQFGPVRVPAGEVFVLGDNRDQSKDSRFWSYPFVKNDRIQGRALLVYWSNYDSNRSGMLVK
jgi:signal peptidase I